MKEFRFLNKMAEQDNPSNRQEKKTVASFRNFYDKICVGFCLNTGQRFVLEVSFESQQKEDRFF